MNYATVVFDLWSRFPNLEMAYRAQFAYMGDEDDPSPYIVFGSILVPALATALGEGDLKSILPICAFLEDVALASRQDNGLLGLMKIEVGEWLGWVANEDRLAPWLGSETKRICNYVPDLATQRLQMKPRSRLKLFEHGVLPSFEV